ncbi:unnamed protein product, partial [Mesorhabditis belari]|uniref:Carboxypeptidase Q n=1 Tax=Mesorhabditis belari TaxID=2138241 RepID=A0AAF3EDP9_9BILA
MGTSLIVTGEEEKSKMSKLLLILLGSSIFVVLVMPTNEQKDAQKKASDQEKFRMKFAQTMMGSVAESEACDKLEGDAKKACLVKIIDKVKEKMGKLRAEEERVMDDGEKILPHLDGVLDKMRLESVLLSIFFPLSTLAYVDPAFRGSSYTLISYLLHGRMKGEAKSWMEEIVDDFGPRMAGTMALENTIDAIAQKLRIEGFQNVHTEPVPGIPHFVRGEDRVTLLEPRRLDLNILAIPGCQPGHVRGQAVVLESFDDFRKVNVQGKIVVMVHKWMGYSWTVQNRQGGVEAARWGAIGYLAKSITPESMGSPHTGWGKSGIPSASITLEDAEMLKRLSKRGKRIEIEMNIRSRVMPDPVISRNTIFDIKGSHHPNEVIILSAHLDSWDVGQGALDDAAGCSAVFHAMKAIKQLAERQPRFQPKRTIRGIFWTAEEQGFYGGRQYYADHGNGQHGEKFVFVSESDNGAFKPTNSTANLAFKGTREQMDIMNEIVTIINSYGIPLKVIHSNGQGDVQQFADDGVPSTMYISDKGWEFYFNFHHSAGDYADKLSAEDLDYTAAIFAVLAHVIGNMREWVR